MIQEGKNFQLIFSQPYILEIERNRYTDTYRILVTEQLTGKNGMNYGDDIIHQRALRTRLTMMMNRKSTLKRNRRKTLETDFR